MNQANKAEARRLTITFPFYPLSEVNNGIRNSLSSAFLTATNLNEFLKKLAGSISAFWRMLAMPLPPLRKIVSRELDIYQPDPRFKNFIYSLIDTLECGHVKQSYLFGGVSDVANAYTLSPVVKAKRHRCRPCAALLAKKKPQSVPYPAARVTA